MLLLVTIALVLVAAVSLVIGFAGNQLGPIEFSILCSALAAVVLFFSSRLAQRRGAVTTTANGPAPLPQGGRVTTPVGPAPEPRPASPARPEERPEPEPATTARSDDSHEDGQDDLDIDLRSPHAIENLAPDRYEDVEDEWDDEEAVFPIEDYDDLRTAEIVPLLYELDDYELEEVRARELTGRRRASVVTRIDQILAGDHAAAPPLPAAPAPRPAPLPPARPGSRSRPASPSCALSPPRSAPSARTASAASATTTLWPARTSPPRPAPRSPLADRRIDSWDDRPRPFPIAGYDELRVAEILPLLAGLEPDELERVAARERRGANRNTILGRIDRLRGAAEQDRDQGRASVAEMTGRVAGRDRRRPRA